MAALLTSMVVFNTKQIIHKKIKNEPIFAKTSNQVLVFVLCHSLKAGLNIYEAYMVTFSLFLDCGEIQGDLFKSPCR